MPQVSSQTVSYLITGVIILLVLMLRLRRVGQSRPLKLEQLWVLPAIYLVFVVTLLVERPPQDGDWLWCLGGLVIGGAIGWYRGKTITITVDPQNHALNQKASPAGVIFLVALIAIRFALRTTLATEAQAWHVSPAMLVDALVILAFGLLAAQRVEMFLRARRLLEGARRGAGPIG